MIYDYSCWKVREEISSFPPHQSLRKGHKEEGLHRSNKLDLANYCRLRASIVAALASSAIEASKRKLPKHYSLLIWDAWKIMGLWNAITCQESSPASLTSLQPRFLQKKVQRFSIKKFPRPLLKEIGNSFQLFFFALEIIAQFFCSILDCYYDEIFWNSIP